MLHWFAKRLREIQEVSRDERGFTLIELLVVIIILLVLAAIAIPTFLAQRERAWSASAASDLRNLTAAMTSYASTNDGSYAGATAALVTAQGFNRTDAVDVDVTCTDTGQQYDATAHHIRGGQQFSFTTGPAGTTFNGVNPGQVGESVPQPAGPPAAAGFTFAGC
jgi:type IV pilus assembly protein PilA